MATSRAKKQRRAAVNASLEELEKEQAPQLPPNDNRYMVLSDRIALMMSRSQLEAAWELARLTSRLAWATIALSVLTFVLAMATVLQAWPTIRELLRAGR